MHKVKGLSHKNAHEPSLISSDLLRFSSIKPPRTFLIPLILFFSVTGIYLMSFNNFDIFLMIGIAVVATILRLYDFPMPPLILAFVLGGLMEENLRRSLLISDGSWSFLWDRPLTLVIMLIIIVIVGWQIYRGILIKK